MLIQVIKMDDSGICGNRRSSTASHRTTMSDSGTRKPASIYEINDLYSALKDLVHSSPSPEHKTLKLSHSNIDSSDSWTSGTDSPDTRSRVGNQRRNLKVIRSSSSITQRFSGTESPSNRIRTPELKPKNSSYQRVSIRAPNTVSGSPKLALKKSKSDASRLRSRSSIEGSKTMAEKIRDQRIKFTQGLRRRELEEEGCPGDHEPVKNIDELVEMAKLQSVPLEIGQKKKRKKHGQRKRLGSLVESGNKIKPNCSDSNLRSLEVTSRLDRWYERATAVALGDIEDENESYDSYSGSESEDLAPGVGLKKGKSLDDIDFGLDSFTADDLLSKWMKQKKNTLMAEERGRSSSETSVEPLSLDEMDSSPGKGEKTPEKVRTVKKKSSNKSPLVINRIIVSQPSLDATESKGENEVSCTNLPNQPIFYIPNFNEDSHKKTTILNENQATDGLLIEPARPRSRSAVSMGETFDRRDDAAWEEIQKIAQRRCKSFGSVHRRGSIDTVAMQERQERCLRTASEYRRRSSRPKSLNLSTDAGEKGITKGEKESKTINDTGITETDANLNILEKDKKHDKGKKLAKLPGKLKTLLTGKKI